MSNILVGSSNVARFYRASSFKGVREYTMVRCTEEASFRATLEDIDDGSNVVMSVIKNFISSRVRGDQPDVDSLVTATIKDYLKTIKDAATKNPGSKFAVVMPLQRPSLKWYQDKLLMIETAMAEGVTQMKLDNVVRVDCISVFSQMFEQDGVHLTKEAGKCFLSVTLELAEAFFKAELVDLADAQEDEDGEASASEVEEDGGGSVNNRELAETRNRLSKLEDDLMKRKLADNLMFARIREELDTAANKSKEDRIVMSGIVSKQPLPEETRARIERLKEIAKGVFEFLIPRFDGKISFVSQGKGQGRLLPMLEVRFEKVESAAAIRKSFADKNKNKMLTGDYEKLFISNSVSLATRVRIDILKVIAKKITNNEDQAYVVGFISRPMLHLKKKTDRRDTKPYKTLTFVDAVESFGRLIYASDLESAYNRAGKAFAGQLQQNFVVLHDEKQAPPAAGPWGYPSYRGERGRRGGSGRGRGFGTPRGSGAARGHGAPGGSGYTKSQSVKRSRERLENEGGSKVKKT
jgi:hypothetical protein